MTSDMAAPENKPEPAEKPVPEEISPPSSGKQHPGPVGRLLATVVIVGALLVLALSPASRLTAQALKQSPDTAVTVVTRTQHASGTAVQSVPAGLPAGARIRTAEDVLPYAVAALGEPGAAALMKLLNSTTYLANSDQTYSTYPYQYAPLNAVLNRAPPGSLARYGTALGAALTVLAAQPQSITTVSADAIDNAGPAAFGVLNRVGAAGGCAVQLDLLLLVAADEYTMDVVEEDPGAGVIANALSGQEQRAEAACPHNPTPAWLVGQSRLRLVLVSAPIMVADPAVLRQLSEARAAFAGLAAEYPRDTAVLAALGDSYLRTGTYLQTSEPFTAKQYFKSAVAEYNRVAELGDEHDAAPGIARALIGLGEPAEAGRLLTSELPSSTEPGELLELLTDADETDHDFTAAAATAQLLAQRGSAAFPDTSALLPVALSGSVDTLDDATLPLSFGVGRITPLTVELIPPGGAGGPVQDLSFIPLYREDTGVTDSQPDCPTWTWTRDELLLGHASLALANWPARFASVQPGRGCTVSGELKLLAEMQAGQPPSAAALKNDDLTADGLADDWQNLLRWAGNLAAAKTAAAQWQAARGDASALPALRLGEIDFLQHQYNAAAAEFGLAARRWRLVAYNGDLYVDQAELDRGAALFEAGRAAEAVQTLRPLDLIGTQGYSYQHSSSQGDPGYAIDFAVVSYYACEQLADYESQSGDLRAAVEDYTNALAWLPVFRTDINIRPEALNNNAALAYLGLGNTGTAAALEAKALASDPKDPVFLMTAAFIAERAGHQAQAIAYNRAALASDPGAFPAANDLGVELLRSHQDAAAAAVLRQAVGASSSYALGWFNLGVVESQQGVTHFAAAQGAFAMAYSLDPALQTRQHQATIDGSVYRTALDLSKPLPPNWSIAQLPQPVPAAAAGLLAIGLLALGLAKATGHGGSALAAQWLDPLSDRLQTAPVLRRLHHPGWSVTATAASFLFAYLRKGAGPVEAVLYVAGVVILVLVAVGGRVIVARRNRIKVTHETWSPAVAVSLVAGAAGLPWAALPVVKAEGKAAVKVHLAAPVILAALSALLFLESAWLHTPVTESWAVAALIMSASTLLPVGPLDGAQLGTAGVLAATGVLAGALLVGLGLI